MSKKMGKKMGRPISQPPLTGDETRDRIITLRLALGLSQRQLGEKIGVTESAVRSWESGSRRPSGPALKMLEMLEE